MSSPKPATWPNSWLHMPEEEAAFAHSTLTLIPISVTEKLQAWANAYMEWEFLNTKGDGMPDEVIKRLGIAEAILYDFAKAWFEENEEMIG